MRAALGLVPLRGQRNSVLLEEDFAHYRPLQPHTLQLRELRTVLQSNVPPAARAEAPRYLLTAGEPRGRSPDVLELSSYP